MSVPVRAGRMSVVAIFVFVICGLFAADASATTDTFGPALPVAIHVNYALEANNAPGSEWIASGAFEQEGHPRAAPVSGKLSQVRLQYGSVTGMEVQIWTANAATGALQQRVATVHLEPTDEPATPCGAKTKIETLSPNTSINTGEVLVLLNSDEKGGVICPYPEGITDGYLGRFGASFQPETGKVPTGWSLQNGLGIALEGTVTTEPTTTSGNSPGGSTGSSNNPGSTGGSPTPSTPNVNVCPQNTGTGCMISVGVNDYEVTINPGGKTVYTKVPGAYELPIKCEQRGLPTCEGESGTYCSCSVPFGAISRTHAPKQILLGRASFKIPTGQTKKVKFRLSRAGQAILRRKHIIHATVVTTMKLSGGKTATIKSKVTITLRH